MDKVHITYNSWKVFFFFSILNGVYIVKYGKKYMRKLEQYKVIKRLKVLNSLIHKADTYSWVSSYNQGTEFEIETHN